MPHFYRYRVDDDPSMVLSTRSSSIMRESNEDTTDASINLLGYTASINVPKTEKEENRKNITHMFLKLESCLKEAMEENRILREEVKRQKEKVDRHEEEIGKLQIRGALPQLVQVGSESNENGDLETKLVGQIEDLKTDIAKKEEYKNKDFDKISTDVSNINDSLEILSKRITLLENKPELTPLNQPPQPQVEEVNLDEVNLDEVSQLRKEMKSSISNVMELVTSPLSVMFDAIRCEDFQGQDGWLSFSKLNSNLGDGMNMETGIFTVPVSGIYLFLINVYGAPRDSVVLSIKCNELSELASCSGVGKASQSVMADLDKEDTIAVWVNDKTKLTDTNINRFTHFIGILLRPDIVRFHK